jgi:hypothetical protein
MIPSQARLDPFNSDPKRQFPGLMKRALDYAFEVLFLKNSPGMTQRSLITHVGNHRRIGVHSSLSFHCTVSEARKSVLSVLSWYQSPEAPVNYSPGSPESSNGAHQRGIGGIEGSSL